MAGTRQPASPHGALGRGDGALEFNRYTPWFTVSRDGRHLKDA